MLHVICGAPCSGKTTYVSNHSRDNDLIIDLDKIASAFGGSDYHAKGEPFEVALKARKMAIEHSLSGKGEYWLIDTLPTTEHLEQYKNANAEIVVIDTPIDICLERAKNRPEGTKETIIKWFERATYLSNYSGRKEMADLFKAITTQEEFDAAIKKRLEQKDRELAEKYRDYMAPDKVDALKAEYDKKVADMSTELKAEKEKTAGFDKEKAELLSRATTAEGALLKNKVASKHKIPIELAERLQGSTEDELEKDAQAFAGYMTPVAAPPMRTNDPSGGLNNPQAATDLALSQLLTALDSH